MLDGQATLTRFPVLNRGCRTIWSLFCSVNEKRKSSLSPFVHPVFFRVRRNDGGQGAGTRIPIGLCCVDARRYDGRLVNIVSLDWLWADDKWAIQVNSGYSNPVEPCASCRSSR